MFLERRCEVQANEDKPQEFRVGLFRRRLAPVPRPKLGRGISHTPKFSRKEKKSPVFKVALPLHILIRLSNGVFTHIRP
jgi:hypothetical protein